MKNYIIFIFVFIVAFNSFTECQTTNRAYKSDADTVPQNTQFSSFGLSVDELKQVDFSAPMNIINSQGRNPKLVFLDKKSGEIQKTIDIKERSPFKDIGEKTGNPNYDVFKTNGKTFKDIFPDLDFKHYVDKQPYNDALPISEVLIEYLVGFSPNMKYSAVSYTCMQHGEESINTSAFALPFRSVISIIDSTGTEISRISNLDAGTNDIGITNDGKFLVNLFGYKDANYGVLINKGIQIIEIDKNRILFEIEDNSINGFFVSNHFIITGSQFFRNKKDERVRLVVVYDLNSAKKYSREFNEEEVNNADFTDEGYRIGKLNSPVYMLYFNKDFKVEDFQ